MSGYFEARMLGALGENSGYTRCELESGSAEIVAEADQEARAEGDARVRVVTDMLLSGVWGAAVVTEIFGTGFLTQLCVLGIQSYCNAPSVDDPTPLVPGPDLPYEGDAP